MREEGCWVIIGILVISNIATYGIARKRIRHLMYFDRITEGVNQKYIRDWFKNALKRNDSAFCFVYLNLAKFKAINDLYGYEKGNELLKLIYNCIKRELTSAERCSRISADNYIIIMKYESADTIERRLKRIGDTINECFNETLESRYHLNFTAGVYIVTDRTLGYSVMADRANIARRGVAVQSHHVVEIGFFDERDRREFLREKEIEDKMDEALEKGEFVVYLQPKLGLAGNDVKGAEALIRWNSPERGLIPPAEFVELFEKNGFIKKIDLYVFETICRLLKKWMDEGTPLMNISVNLSRLHFADSKFLEKFDEIRQKYGVPSEYLEFELTERIVFEEPDVLQILIASMRRMRELGYRCSLDDFGSGYSCLNILKELPIDVIKLDRGFFTGQYNEQSRVIIRAVINMAKELDMETVAEGVDTQEQCTFLRESGCNMMQAFLYKRPMPIDEFERLIKAG